MVTYHGSTLMTIVAPPVLEFSFSNCNIIAYWMSMKEKEAVLSMAIWTNIAKVFGLKC